MNKNQKGFSAVELLIALLVVAVLAGGGYFVYNKHNQDTAKTAASTTDSTKAVPVGVSELKVTELGIKVVLKNPVVGLYYKIDATGNAAGNTEGVAAGISTRTLDKLDAAKCGADAEGAPGGIYFFTDPTSPDPYTGDSTNAQAFPDALKVGDKYYALATSQGACNTDPAVEKPFTSAVTALKQASLKAL
jgi:prepilin-type N-terminal cleavage/methylation domain-containing protein